MFKPGLADEKTHKFQIVIIEKNIKKPKSSTYNIVLVVKSTNFTVPFIPLSVVKEKNVTYITQDVKLRLTKVMNNGTLHLQISPPDEVLLSLLTNQTLEIFIYPASQLLPSCLTKRHLEAF